MLDFAALVHECAPWVAHETMAAIVKTESGFRPLAIGVNGGSKLARQADNVAEAVATANWLISNGYNIDLGLGQVNSSNLAKTGLTVKNAFDPCKNIAAAGKILLGNYQLAISKGLGEQAALHAAISAYNTGSLHRGFTNGYVQKVIGNAGVVVPGITPQRVAPIALVGTKAPARTRSQPDSQTVKLRVISSDETGSLASNEGAGDPDTSNVMVYR